MKNEVKLWIVTIGFFLSGVLLEVFSDLTNKESFLVIPIIFFGVFFGYYIGKERERKFAKRTKEVKK